MDKAECRLRGGQCTCAGACAIETRPSHMPVPKFDVLRDAGKLFTEAGREDLLKESSTAAAKMLYVAFHSCQLETHIDVTFDIEPGQSFRLRFDKLSVPEIKAANEQLQP
jgi:hypothetical protein